MSTRENLDPREGFDAQTAAEYEAYLDQLEAGFDYDDDGDYYDGQPSELTEWLDFDPDC